MLVRNFKIESTSIDKQLYCFKPKFYFRFKIIRLLIMLTKYVSKPNIAAFCGKRGKFMSCLPYCQLYCDTPSGQVLSKCTKRPSCESGCVCDGKTRFKLVEDGTCVSSCSVAKKPVTKEVPTSDNDISRSKCLTSFCKHTTMWVNFCNFCLFFSSNLKNSSYNNAN